MKRGSELEKLEEKMIDKRFRKVVKEWYGFEDDEDDDEWLLEQIKITEVRNWLERLCFNGLNVDEEYSFGKTKYIKEEMKSCDEFGLLSMEFNSDWNNQLNGFWIDELNGIKKIKKIGVVEFVRGYLMSCEWGSSDDLYKTKIEVIERLVESLIKTIKN